MRFFVEGNTSVKMLQKFQHRSGSGQDFIWGAQICTPPVKSGYEIARCK